MRFIVMITTAALLLSGCQPHIPKDDNFFLKKTSFLKLPNWEKGNKTDTAKAYLASCKVIEKLPQDKAITAMTYAKDWQQPCQALKKLDLNDKDAVISFFEHWFDPYEVYDKGQSTGLFTGYYLPVLKGSLKPSQRYQYPVYGKPRDLVVAEDLGIFRPGEYYKGKRIAGKVNNGHLKPYHSRAAIEGGALKDQNLELLWVDDDIDLFFLQIQGSGVIELEDGQRIGVGYNGTNGHLYTSIGKLLVDRGELTLDTVSMPTIKDWLRAHPDEKAALLHENASYVFFKTQKKTSAIGAQGVALTPGVSLAVDTAFVPMGTPIWLDIEHPGHNRMQALMVAQDTGGAINGSIRGDLFWGEGKEAESLAGKMRFPGQYFLLMPNLTKTRG